jgi:hypothetical protein
MRESPFVSTGYTFARTEYCKELVLFRDDRTIYRYLSAEDFGSAGIICHMSRVYDEIVEFIAAGTTPQAVAEYQASDETKNLVGDLIHKQKTIGLTAEETEDLQTYLRLEHLMRLAKARARQRIGHE